MIEYVPFSLNSESIKSVTIISPIGCLRNSTFNEYKTRQILLSRDSFIAPLIKITFFVNKRLIKAVIA